MKRIQLLTCLSTLILTLSVGACSDSNDDGLNDKSQSNESGDSGSTTSGSSHAKNPSELIEIIHDCCNYTLTLEYDYYESEQTITYADYQSDNYDFAEIYGSMSIQKSFVFNIYYTKNAIDVESYIYDGNEYVYDATTIFVNDSGMCWEYTYQEGDYYWDYFYGAGDWSTYCNSLLDSYDYGVQNHFTYYSSGSINGKNCDAYTYDSAYIPYLFIGLGTDFLFENPTSTASNYKHYFTYFFEEPQEMLVNFYNEGWFYNGALNSDTVLYCRDYEIYADVYDVGSTDDSYALYLHELFQEQLS